MTFEEVLQGMEGLSTERKIEAAVDSYMKLVPLLKDFDPVGGGLVLFNVILSAAASADGVVSEAERELIGALYAAMDVELNDEEITALVKACNDTNAVKLVKGFASLLTEEQMETLMTFLAAIFSIDERVTREEYAMLNLVGEA